MEERSEALVPDARNQGHVSLFGRGARAHRNAATAIVLVFLCAVIIGASWLVAVGAAQSFVASVFGVMIPVTSALVVYVALIAWLFVRRGSAAARAEV